MYRRGVKAPFKKESPKEIEPIKPEPKQVPAQEDFNFIDFSPPQLTAEDAKQLSIVFSKFTVPLTLESLDVIMDIWRQLDNDAFTIMAFICIRRKSEAITVSMIDEVLSIRRKGISLKRYIARFMSDERQRLVPALRERPKPPARELVNDESKLALVG